MKLSFLVSVAMLVCTPLFSHAQVKTEASIIDFLKNKLNVKIANSCQVMEKQGKDPSGPFEQIDKCDEGEIKDLKQITGKVYRVVDGDTIQIFTKNKLLSIRMLGMDTPELHYLARAQPKWGELARDSLRSMVESGDIITLELDKVKCDRYGRILGHAFKGKMNLNFEQIRRKDYIKNT